MSTSSEWTVVTRDCKRRVARLKKRNISKHGNHDCTLRSEFDWTDVMKEQYLATMALSMEALQNSDFYNSILSHEIVDRSRHSSISQIVCYGVGNFSAPYSAAMWQMACALLLKRLFDKEGTSSVEHETIPLFFYDPCMTPMEKQILAKEWDVQVIDENEQGKRRVLGKTLFFMPHCPKSLYENVLWSNWDCLDLVTIFGNSFLAYDERLYNSVARGKSCVSLLLPFLSEKQVRLSNADAANMAGNIEEAFNDCYLVSFNKYNKELPSKPDEPEIDCCDELV